MWIFIMGHLEGKRDLSRWDRKHPWRSILSVPSKSTSLTSIKPFSANCLHIWSHFSMTKILSSDVLVLEIQNADLNYYHDCLFSPWCLCYACTHTHICLVDWQHRLRKYVLIVCVSSKYLHEENVHRNLTKIQQLEPCYSCHCFTDKEMASCKKAKWVNNKPVSQWKSSTVFWQHVPLL